MGFSPFRANASTAGKKEDSFSGGRSYYYPEQQDNTKAKIIHQSSANGMQAIPTTGLPRLIVLEQK